MGQGRARQGGWSRTGSGGVGWVSAKCGRVRWDREGCSEQYGTTHMQKPAAYFMYSLTDLRAMALLSSC